MFIVWIFKLLIIPQSRVCLNTDNIHSLLKCMMLIFFLNNLLRANDGYCENPFCYHRYYSPHMRKAKAGMKTNMVRYRALLSKGYKDIEGAS